MKRPSVILFDVDGTLISTGGAGRRAMAAAFAEVCDAPDALSGISFAGMTDPLILRQALASVGKPVEPEIIAAILESYLGHLRQLVPQSPNYQVMPKVESIVGRLSKMSSVAIGLGTGNIEEGARVKLARASLSEPFAFGGFGSDAEDRAELIAVGARRGADQLGVRVSQTRVVVVGDTPKDVAAAHANDAICIAVATGGCDRNSLIDSGADFVYPSLADPQVWSALTGEH